MYFDDETLDAFTIIGRLIFVLGNGNGPDERDGDGAILKVSSWPNGLAVAQMAAIQGKMKDKALAMI